MFWRKAKEIEKARENESAGWLVRGTRARKPHFRGAGVDRWVCVGEWVVVGRVRFAGRWWMVGRIGSHGCRRIPVFCVAGSSSHVLGWCVSYQTLRPVHAPAASCGRDEPSYCLGLAWEPWRA
jgi:hypothetical protein